MLPVGAGAGALEQLRQQREDARRVAAGGRAARRPTGRSRAGPCATRVRLSIISSTSRPWSRNALGDAGGDEGRRSRTSGGSSEVATTTTERARPSGPRSSSRNSRTSRPRSPTRAITLTSASVPRAIIAAGWTCRRRSRRRCRCAGPGRTGPGRRARARRGERLVDAGAAQRVRGCWPGRRRRRASRSGGPPSSGRPSPSSTRPSSASPTGDLQRLPVARTGAPA